jgi:integrase
MGKVNKKEEIKDVQPIRSQQGIEDMKWALRRFCSERDAMLFSLGINTGLRVTDLLALKARDVKGKKTIVIKEGKTEKQRKLYLKGIYEELNAYIQTLDSKWLFPSSRKDRGDKPITRIQAYRALNRAAEMAGLDAIGTHTMRKTYGYWFYKKTMDIAKLQHILNHSKPEITKRYIGITEEEIEEDMEDFYL